MTTPQTNIASYLKIREEIYADQKQRNAIFKNIDLPHLSDNELRQLTKPGALADTSNMNVRHLSLCPSCFKKYILWQKAVRDAKQIDDELEEESDLQNNEFSYGFLQAAAGKGVTEAIELHSQCGHFTLKIMPEIDNPDQGLVILESCKYEGCNLTVRDRQGRNLISGKLHNGSLLKKSPGLLSEIDLSTWVIRIQRK